MSKHTLSTIGAHYEVSRVAALLDMSPRWVKERIKAGELDGYRLGHKIVVPETSLQQYLANHAMHQAGPSNPDSDPPEQEPVAA